MRREDHPRLRRWFATFALALTAAAVAPAAPFVDAARGPTPIDQTTSPPRLLNQVNDDRRLPRNYRYQPPVIPHRIDGYQVDRHFNKCMDCHSFQKAKASGATKVSVTHFKTREGTELDNISPRRYFCTQCHVPQTDARPLVDNTFQRARGLQ